MYNVMYSKLRNLEIVFTRAKCCDAARTNFKSVASVVYIDTHVTYRAKLTSTRTLIHFVSVGTVDTPIYCQSDANIDIIVNCHQCNIFEY